MENQITKRKELKSLVGVFVLTLILCSMGTTVHAATTSVWKEAAASYYNASIVYSNAWRDGYSFCIDKLCKKGKTTDKYDKLDMQLVATNPKMYLQYDRTLQQKNIWTITAEKGKTYSYLFVDKNGTIGTKKTGLNSMIRGYNGKNMNTLIKHTVY